MKHKSIFIIKYENEIIAVTNNPIGWLAENNKQRVADGNEKEYLSNFEVSEKQLEHFKFKSVQEMKKEILTNEVNDIHEACESLGHSTSWEYFETELKTYNKIDCNNLLMELQHLDGEKEVE